MKQDVRGYVLMKKCYTKEVGKVYSKVLASDVYDVFVLYSL
ncbi:hypothetical protein [Candidatus Profftia tarda]|uniref:Uncharacterized protein n=1 Tax=Candidatus Profftia tarda TaxID=1177216 RepID=A0A8E4EYS0_9ENTR|nr:hypothetical protein [Candidatus Profftia tarda]CAD6512547.1 hypothetical protein PROFFT_A_06260 [Candidatus Profftia tarda]